MSQPFSIRPGATDEHTLLLAGADSGWLRGKSLVGPDFVNHGAKPEDGGYRFVRAEHDYMDATFAGQPNRGACTLEAWVRNFEPDVDWKDMLLYWWKDASNRLRIYLWSYGHLRFDVTIANVTISANWPGGATLEVLVASSKCWHVAGSFDGTTARLFVNGVEKASAAYGSPQTMPLGDWTFRINSDHLGSWGYMGEGIYDEVRLSKVARYPTDFVITRYGEGERAGLRGPGETVEVAGGCV